MKYIFRFKGNIKLELWFFSFSFKELKMLYLLRLVQYDRTYFDFFVNSWDDDNFISKISLVD